MNNEGTAVTVEGPRDSSHWVKFKDRKSGCIEICKGEDLATIAAEFGEVASHHQIPYPATPRIRIVPLADGLVIPPFCYSPDRCKGTSCPSRYSCTE